VIGEQNLPRRRGDAEKNPEIYRGSARMNAEEQKSSPRRRGGAEKNWDIGSSEKVNPSSLATLGISPAGSDARNRLNFETQRNGGSGGIGVG
jgi:hypothetical protein